MYLYDFFEKRKGEKFGMHQRIAPAIFLAEFLMHLAIKFIIYHEYGHIVRGHLRYLHSRTSEVSFDEAGDGNIKGSDSILLLFQNMEVDADAGAASFAMEYEDLMLHYPELIHSSARIYIKDWKTYLRFWLF